MWSTCNNCLPIQWSNLGAAHYARLVERTLDKLPSREQGRSPMKYTNYGVYISLERKVCLLEESLGFLSCLGQSFHHWRNSWGHYSQKMMPYRHFGGRCSLTFGIQCEGPTNKLLLYTNQIAGILCPLNQRQQCEAPLSSSFCRYLLLCMQLACMNMDSCYQFTKSF